MASFDKAFEYASSRHGLCHGANDDLKQIIKNDFWRFSPLTSEKIASAMFELSTHVGVERSIYLAQRTLARMNFFAIADGALSASTIHTLNSIYDEGFIKEFKKTIWQEHYFPILECSVTSNTHIDDKRKACIIDSLRLTDWPSLDRVIKIVGHVKADQLCYAKLWFNRIFGED